MSKDPRDEKVEDVGVLPGVRRRRADSVSGIRGQEEEKEERWRRKEAAKAPAG